MRITQIAVVVAGLMLTCAPAFADQLRSPGAVEHRTIVRSGHKLAIQIIPGRTPAIVLDAGGGQDSTHWSDLAPRIARETGAMVVTYDRAGMGNSDEVPGPWRLDAATDDLEAVLRGLGATRGVILVSHSLSGEIATKLSGRHPDWFAGAVLVDASVPDFYTDAMVARQAEAYKPALAMARQAPASRQARSLLALAASFEPESRAFHKLEWPSAVPATVIVSEKTPMTDPADAQAWRAAQASFAGKSSNRKLIVADRSSHDVVHDRPDVVLEAVIAMRGAAIADKTAVPTYDLVIRHGRVIDGGGNPWVRADVAIKDGLFVKVGAVTGKGRREIDATGLYVTPGWIDDMDQSGESLLEDGRAESKVLQGVTTAIAGEGGAPVGSAKISEFFDTLRRQGISMNFGTLYGAAQARVEVMGDVDGVPTPQQLDQERSHVEQAMRAGAMGLGTALIYAPASYQQTPELIELAKVAQRYGGIYAHHMRDEGEKLLDGVRESIAIAEQSGIAVEIYHLKAAFAPGWGKLMTAAGQMIGDARARGVDIAADMYPYRAAGTGLEITVPNWLWAEGKQQGLRKLTDPKVREVLKRQVATGSAPGWTNLVTATGGWGHIVLIDPKSPKYDRFRFKDLATIGRELKQDPADAAWDIVLSAQPQRATALFFAMDERDIETALRFPWTSIGSDATATSGGQHADGHPRAYGTFPRVIAEYVRDRNVITLEDAVRKMTSWPAARFKLFDRGMIREGLRADVTIFDYARIKDLADYEKPTAAPQGIDYVVVNGTVVVDGGRHTGATPGMVLKGQGATAP